MAVVERRQAPIAKDGSARHQALRQIQIVRRQDDQPARAGERAEAAHQRRRRCLVETGKGFVEQQQTRLVQQRTLQRQPLAHAARKSRDGIVRALDQPG